MKRVAKRAAAVPSYRYSALTYAQRTAKGAPPFVLFHASVREIASWADVDRLGPDNPRGGQRPLRTVKVNKVRQFLAADRSNTIPTSVVIALDADAVSFSKSKGNASGAGDVCTLTISVRDNQKPGLIIDGQHRVFGAKRFHEDVHLNIVAFLGGDDAERAFQFIVINNTPTRISKDHIKALNLSFDEGLLNERLVKAARLGIGEDERVELQIVNEAKPFRGLLKLPTNHNGYIPATAIEAALAEVHGRSDLLGVTDYEIDVFLAMWEEISQKYERAWTAQSQLLKKVSIYAVTRYVLDSMSSSQRGASEPLDLLDSENLAAEVQRALKHIPEVFWLSEWTSKELDTSSGRQRVVEALEVIDANGRYKRPWHTSVSVVDSATVESRPNVRARRSGSGGTKKATKKATKKTAAGKRRLR